MKKSPAKDYSAWITSLFLFCGMLFISCGTPAPGQAPLTATGAEQTALYLPLLEGKSVGLVANHTTVIGKSHLADSLLKLGVNLVKILHRSMDSGAMRMPGRRSATAGMAKPGYPLFRFTVRGISQSLLISKVLTL